MKDWYLKNHSYRRELLAKNKYNVLLEGIQLLRGHHDLIHSDHECGYFVLDGEISFGGRKYRKDTLLWFTGGKHAEVYLERHVHALYIESRKPLKETYELNVFAADEMDWNRVPAENECFSKYMLKAEKDDIKFQIIVYAKGFDHEMHSHSIMHGFYILDGMMKVTYPSGFEYFGPGEFVYMDPGTESIHIQAEECDYCKCAMIGNGVLDFIVNGVNLRG